MAIQVIKEGKNRPIRIWTQEVEEQAMVQLKNLAAMPFLHPHGVAAMPDVHAGKGSTIGSVIATDKAIIPAAVGVDIGCGMNAVRTSLKASDLPDSLSAIRGQIERDVPLGAGGAHKDKEEKYVHRMGSLPKPDPSVVSTLEKLYTNSKVPFGSAWEKVQSQLGTLGSGKLLPLSH